MKRAIHSCIILWFAAVLGVPLAAFLFNIREGQIENRPLAPAPDISLPSMFNVEMYRQISAYFRDHVPFRSYAIWWDAWLDVHVFGDSPNPDVGLGADGWLFSAEHHRQACQETLKPAEIVGWIAAVSHMLQASGRQFLFVIVPEKEFLYPEYLGDFAADVACTRAHRSQLRALLADSQPPGYIDVWSMLERMKSASPELVYFPHDTHWTFKAAAGIAEEVIEALCPGLWDSAAVRIKKRDKIGGLSRLIGMPYAIKTDAVAVKRPDIEVQLLDDNKRRGPYSYATSGVGDMIEGHTFVMHNSFFKHTRLMINSYLARSTFMRWGRLKSRADWAAKMMAESDVVIVQMNELGIGKKSHWEEWRRLPAALARQLSPSPTPAVQRSSRHTAMLAP